MSQERVEAELKAKLDAARQALKEAKEIADDHSLSFSFRIGAADNVSRAIGGQYYGKGSEIYGEDKEEVTQRWGGEDHLEVIEDTEDEWGESMYRLTRGSWSAWQSSSEMC